MSNLLLKKECAAAQVCGTREGRGWLRSHLTTPVQQRTFFMRRGFYTGVGKVAIMATATIGSGSRNRLTAGQSAQRREAAAIAELERNGIQVDKSGERYELPALAPEPPERVFRSNPDAVEIPKSAITNFEPLTKFDRLAIDAAVADAQWGDWSANDVRWTLTPAEWRKLKRKGLTDQKLKQRQSV